jgi:hypothetical protein
METSLIVVEEFHSMSLLKHSDRKKSICSYYEYTNGNNRIWLPRTFQFQTKVMIESKNKFMFGIFLFRLVRVPILSFDYNDIYMIYDEGPKR